MFVQIHMLQSMPPGNLNRDETGQPKKAIFGGVTRGRISSQCLKRNIRLSQEFKNTFGDSLADRTAYLPSMVAMEIQKDPELGIPEEEIEALMAGLIKYGKFGGDSKKKNKSASGDEDSGEDSDDSSSGDTKSESKTKPGQTPQLVFCQQPFARRIGELASEFRKQNEEAYKYLLGKGKKPSKEEKQRLDAIIRNDFVAPAFKASQTLTVDIGLFGRMTTSDLVANVEATCQVAHAISTHEVVVEDDFWTAMDDKKKDFAKTQTEALGSGMGSFDEKAKTFYDSAVYYKYFNLDLDSLQKHLPGEDMAKVAETFLKAAAFNNPTGKQNSFAAHGAPEFILIEISPVKRPISYANAFLQPVEGGVGKNLMTESSDALCRYIDSAASAFAPADTKRLLLVWGKASDALTADHLISISVDELAQAVDDEVRKHAK